MHHVGLFFWGGAVPSMGASLSPLFMGYLARA